MGMDSMVVSVHMGHSPNFAYSYYVLKALLPIWRLLFREERFGRYIKGINHLEITELLIFLEVFRQ